MTAPAWVPTQHARFMAEREVRAENSRHRGDVGHCRTCGKPGAGWSLFCRRKRCKTCRAAARARFEASVMPHIPFWPEAV